MKILVILNSSAGKQSSPGGESQTEEIVKAFQAVNVEAQVACPEVPDGGRGPGLYPGVHFRRTRPWIRTTGEWRAERSSLDLTAFTKQALISPFDAVIAAGGDGTISAVAAALVGTLTPLGILPLGTLNHLARDLKISFNLQEAVRTIAEGKIREIDVGEVNGRIFVNNSSIGLYPKAVRKRNQEIIRLGRGKWPAMLDASLRVFLRFPLITIRLETPDGSLTQTTPFLFVGNNPYEMKFLRIGDRRSLEGGELCAYLLKHTGRLALLRILLLGILGLKHDRDFVSILSREVQVQTRRRRIVVSADGQLMTLDTPLNYRIRPKVLRVLAPETEKP